MVLPKVLALVAGLFFAQSAEAMPDNVKHTVLTFASESYLNGTLKLTPEQRKELDCYAKVIWFEARGEKKKGKTLVANVVQNRMKYGKPFATTVCAVVYQRNQFAWTRDSKKKNARFKDVAKRNMATEGEQVMDTLNVALNVILFDPKPKTSATHFCSIGEKCRFANVRKLGQIGGHTTFEYLGNL